MPIEWALLAFCGLRQVRELRWRATYPRGTQVEPGNLPGHTTEQLGVFGRRPAGYRVRDCPPATVTIQLE